MPQLALAALLDRLRQKPASAAVYLHGEEEYLKEHAVRTVVDIFLDPATRDFNLDQVRGGDASPEGLASLLATPPMMADYRVVVLRDAQGLSPKARDVVEQSLSRLGAGVVLLIEATVPSGSKAKFYDTLRGSALSVEFGAIDPLDLPGWLLEHTEVTHGVALDLEAARALAAAIGTQLGILVTEIEKAAAYVGTRKHITLADIQAVGGYIPRVDRWGWIDKIGERRFREALQELPDLLDTGENGVVLTMGIGTHMIRLGLLVAGGREGLERHLKGNQRWLANKLQPQARRWSNSQIDRALGELLRTDRLLKTASLNDRQAIEELLLRLADDGGDPTPASRSQRSPAVAGRR
jgi:DNA polymerase III subunit delta